MMADRINHKDIELLSAYLDEQISAGDRQRLDSRLAREAALRRALADLRQTRELLRIAPQVQRPRSFTLTPEMVGSRAWLTRAFSAMRMVSVVASILFAVIFAGDLFFNSFSAETVSFAPQANDMAAEGDMAEESFAGAAADRAADGADQELELFDAPDAEAPEEGLGEDAAADDADAGEADADDAAAPSEDESQAPPGLGETGLSQTGTPELSATPAPLGTASPAPTQTPEAATNKSTDTDETDIQSTDEQPIPTNQAFQEFGAEDGIEGLIDDESDPKRESGFALSSIQVIEVGLALFAVASGLAAWLLRRQTR